MPADVSRYSKPLGHVPRRRDDARLDCLLGLPLLKPFACYDNDNCIERRHVGRRKDEVLWPAKTQWAERGADVLSGKPRSAVDARDGGESGRGDAMNGPRLGSSVALSGEPSPSNGVTVGRKNAPRNVRTGSSSFVGSA